MQETIAGIFKRAYSTRLTLAKKPATTPIPVPRSDTGFPPFLLPPLSMPQRGPQGTLGYHRLCHLLFWVL